MPTFQKAHLNKLAETILNEFETHRPLIDADVRVDFVFANADLDDDGNPKNDAIRHQGVKAHGLCRIMSLKDRAMGRGDAEICLDGDWWMTASESQQRALLDHELHHLSVKTKGPVVLVDDLGRPKLKMRKHDVQVGWFNIIAQRHGAASGERIQAKKIADEFGQYYWPEMVGSNVISMSLSKTA